jgi:hypothetical protein
VAALRRRAGSIGGADRAGGGFVVVDTGSAAVRRSRERHPSSRLIGRDEAPLDMRIRIWVATALITSGLWATWLAPANASLEALFAPSKDLWPRWTTHDERSRQVVDHSAFDRLLGRYLSLDSTGVARFAYGRATPDDSAALRGYLNALAAIRVSGLSRQEQLAFWINLYNALTIDIVLAHYPVRLVNRGS